MTIADRPSRALRAAILAAGLACALVLVIGVAAARAASSHPTETDSFGPDGTAASEFSEVNGIDFNEANGHLFVAGNKPEESRQIFGYAVNSPTARTPLGGAFPITSPEGGSSLAVGDGTGDIYLAGSNSVYGYKENGELVSSRFPLKTPPSPFGPAYLCRVTTDGSANLWVTDYEPNEIVEFTPTGAEIRGLHIGGNEFQGSYCAIAFDHKNGDMFVSKEGGPVRRFTAASDYTRSVEVWPEAARNLAVDSETGIVYATVQHFSPYENAVVAFRENGAPIEKFAKAEPEINGIAIDEADDSVYLTRFGKVHVYAAGPIIADVATGPVTAATVNSATVSATVNTAGGPEITSCRFDYGETTAYSLGSVPCDQGNFTGEATVTATLNNLQSGRTYHYRIDVTNGNGKTSTGADRLASVAGPPTIEGLFATEVTANSANLNARINPRGATTTYRFEYGTTVAYGSEAPLGGGPAGAGQDPQTVVTTLAGLGAGTYHFRVVATNTYGTVVSADQTFSFYPPDCPNAPPAPADRRVLPARLPRLRAGLARQCRRLIMIPDGAPDAPYATNPTRFPFGAVLGAIPGTEPTNATGGDTYVATRTDTGWVTHYTGSKGSETLDQGGSGRRPRLRQGLRLPRPTRTSAAFPQPTTSCPTSGTRRATSSNGGRRTPRASRGATKAAAPTSRPPTSPTSPSPPTTSPSPQRPDEAPGSAYDYDVANHTTTADLAAPERAADPAESGQLRPARIHPLPRRHRLRHRPSAKSRGLHAVQDHPSVSTDGSHILMSTSRRRLLETGLVKLYMRVNDAVTYMVSQEPRRQLRRHDRGRHPGLLHLDRTARSPEDTDKSVDLYMWSEATDSLTLLLAGRRGAGQQRRLPGRPGRPNAASKWCSAARRSDYPIATESGDIYFYSPEQLAGPTKASPNRRNLYVYRNGRSSSSPRWATRGNEESAVAGSRSPRRPPHGVPHRHPARHLRQRRPTQRCTPSNRKPRS